MATRRSARPKPRLGRPLQRHCSRAGSISLQTSPGAWMRSPGRRRLTVLQGGEPITLEITAAWPVPLSGEHRLTLTNSFDPKHSASWFAMDPARYR